MCVHLFVITSTNEIGRRLCFCPCLFVCLFVNNFLPTILVVEWWNLQELIGTLICGSYSILEGQSRAKGQIHLIGYNFAYNCHSNFKLGSYFNLWKTTPNMTLTLTLKSSLKVKNFWNLSVKKFAKICLDINTQGIIHTIIYYNTRLLLAEVCALWAWCL